MSLVTRLVANYVDGLRDPDATHWCLDKGKLQPWKAIFQKARLDSSIPRMRLQQWQVYCVRKKMEFKGKKLLALAVHAFAKLIRDGAWGEGCQSGDHGRNFECDLGGALPILTQADPTRHLAVSWQRPGILA